MRKNGNLLPNFILMFVLRNLSTYCFSLYYYFRKLLYWNDNYVVIGYSFRDQSINNAFADALRNKSNSRLIVVNSNIKNIQSRIDQYFSKLSAKVDIIEARFGDNNLFPKLKDVLG
jgi:hypothetical protein